MHLWMEYPNCNNAVQPTNDGVTREAWRPIATKSCCHFCFLCWIKVSWWHCSDEKQHELVVASTVWKSAFLVVMSQFVSDFLTSEKSPEVRILRWFPTHPSIVNYTNCTYVALLEDWRFTLCLWKADYSTHQSTGLILEIIDCESVLLLKA